MTYDVVIVGTGPAGVSCALNLKILGKTFVWLGSRELSDKVSRAELISNYPGIPAASGETLRRAFLAHIDAMGIEIVEEMVTSIMAMGDHYAVMAGSDFFETNSVILATGVAFTRTLPGEADLVGRGVSYCATCDGMLFRDKTIAVISNNARFEHEVEFLAGLASTLHFLPAYKDPHLTGNNVCIHDKRPARILGDGRASGVELTDGTVLAVDGVFCLRDSITLSSLLPELSLMDGHIAVDRQMATNLPGVFAAGDCTGRPYQYAKSVGEGNVAAHSAVAYLAARS